MVLWAGFTDPPGLVIGSNARPRSGTGKVGFPGSVIGTGWQTVSSTGFIGPPGSVTGGGWCRVFAIEKVGGEGLGTGAEIEGERVIGDGNRIWRALNG